MLTLKTFYLFLALLVAAATMPLMAQRGDDADRKSKNGKTKGKIDGVDVVLEYGRPKVNARKIWGELVPFDKVWRTGANEATTIMVSGDVLVEGKELKTGTYSLFTIPTEKDWTIIFNKVATQWGAFKYDEAEDVLRIIVSPVKKDTPIEEMDFVIEGNNVVLRWEKLTVPINIKVKK
jgi:hypothetical protein